MHGGTPSVHLIGLRSERRVEPPKIKQALTSAAAATSAKRTQNNAEREEHLASDLRLPKWTVRAYARSVPPPCSGKHRLNVDSVRARPNANLQNRRKFNRVESMRRSVKTGVSASTLSVCKPK